MSLKKTKFFSKFLSLLKALSKYLYYLCLIHFTVFAEYSHTLVSAGDGSKTHTRFANLGHSSPSRSMIQCPQIQPNVDCLVLHYLLKKYLCISRPGS